MGTRVRMTEADFTIPNEHEKEALEALKDEETDRWGYVHDDLEQHQYLKDALAACRMQVDVDDERNISIEGFSGQKMADERELLAALAPYVEDGSYVQWHFPGHEQSERYVVAGDEIEVIQPEKKWPDPTSD